MDISLNHLFVCKVTFGAKVKMTDDDISGNNSRYITSQHTDILSLMRCDSDAVVSLSSNVVVLSVLDLFHYEYRPNLNDQHSPFILFSIIFIVRIQN